MPVPAVNQPAQDILVIGGGIAGLTAGAYLARAGLPVTVFERHRLPGGYVSSFNRSGYCFPAGLTSFCSNGIVFPILKELGIDGERPFERVYRQVSWGDADVPLRESGQVERQFAVLFPEDVRGLRSYFRLVAEGERWMQAFEERNIYLDARLPKLLSLLLALPIQAPHLLWMMLRRRNATNRDIHALSLKNACLRELFDQLGYPVMPAFNTVGMWVSFLTDYWAPSRGMQAFANSFVRYIKERGGVVRLSTGVRRVLFEGDTAVGVELDDGRQVKAGAVISTADLRHTCFDLIGRERLPEALLKKLEQGVPSETMFTVYLGLGEACGEAGALDRFRESHVLFFPRSGRLIQLVLLSKDDPTLAPPGKHALCISAFSPYEDWQPWVGNHDAAYQACKDAEAWSLIHLAEEFIPGLSTYIEEMDAATPLTYERYSGNWKGASVGWSWDPSGNPRIDFKKDFPTLPNFYLAGHWTFRLGGMLSAMITARYAALEICKAVKIDARVLQDMQKKNREEAERAKTMIMK